MRQQAVGTLALWLRKKFTVEVHVSYDFPIREFVDAVAGAIAGTVATPIAGHAWELRVKS